MKWEIEYTLLLLSFKEHKLSILFIPFNQESIALTDNWIMNVDSKIEPFGRGSCTQRSFFYGEPRSQPIPSFIGHSDQNSVLYVSSKTKEGPPETFQCVAGYLKPLSSSSGQVQLRFTILFLIPCCYYNTIQYNTMLS